MVKDLAVPWCRQTQDSYSQKNLGSSATAPSYSGHEGLFIPAVQVFCLPDTAAVQHAMQFELSVS